MNDINSAVFKDNEGYLLENYKQFYISVDPATAKKKKSDYTVVLVHEILPDGRWLLVDGVRDKLNSEERIDAVFCFVHKYDQPQIKKRPLVTYETIGFQLTDVENIQKRQRFGKQLEDGTVIDKDYYFTIEEVKTTTSSKEDRIRALQPMYFNKRILWKKSIPYQSKWDNKTHDLISEIKLEYLQFPFSTHDDILDCQSQLMQINISVPKGKIKPKEEGEFTFNRIQKTIKKMNMLHNIKSNQKFSNEALYKYALGWR